MYRNIDTNEIWTEEEIKDMFNHEPELHEAYESFEDYMNYLLDLCRQGIGGVVEVD